MTASFGLIGARSMFLNKSQKECLLLGDHVLPILYLPDHFLSRIF